MKKFLSDFRDLIKLKVMVAFAIRKLGRKNVFTIDDVGFGLGLLPFWKFAIPYSHETIVWCAKENKKGELWKLIPKFGFSIYFLQNMLPEEFCPSYALDASSTSLFSFDNDPGYLLVNLKPFLVGESEQERVKFLQTHSQFARLKVSTVVEILITVKKLRNERHLKQIVHCSEIQGSCSCLIGRYDENGLLVTTIPKDALLALAYEDHGMLLCRIPEYRRA